jgi:hypothetical protein
MPRVVQERAPASDAMETERAPASDAMEAEAREVLAAPPRPPVDVGRFTSNVLFGQPGIYPDGPPMAPAVVPSLRGGQVEQELHRLLDARGVEPAVAFDDGRLAERVPEPALRAACVLLAATVAAPAVVAMVDGDRVATIRYGEPSSPGRVVGLPPGEGDRGEVRVVNDRYRAEHFALVAPSLAHDLLHRPVGARQAEESFLHAVLAMVHLQLLAAAPDLGDLRTELGRRQHSLAITLVNSRPPGDDRIRLVAPDGPGTIPGGDPALQSPDWWSIPFGNPSPGPDEVPAALTGVLSGLTAPRPADDAPRRFGDELASWFDVHHSRAWLSVRAQLRASVALGLIDPDRTVRQWAGLDESRD